MAMKGRHRPASTAGYLTDAVRRDDVLELRGPVAGYFVWSGLPTAPTPNRHDRCSWWPEELAVAAEVRALGSGVSCCPRVRTRIEPLSGVHRLSRHRQAANLRHGHLGVQK